MIRRSYCGTVSFDVVLRFTMQLTLHLHCIMECSCIDTARCLLSGTLHCMLYYSLFLSCTVVLFCRWPLRRRWKNECRWCSTNSVRPCSYYIVVFRFFKLTSWLPLSFVSLFVLSDCSENRQKGGQKKTRNKRTRKKGKNYCFFISRNSRLLENAKNERPWKQDWSRGLCFVRGNCWFW